MDVILIIFKLEKSLGVIDRFVTGDAVRCDKTASVGGSSGRWKWFSAGVLYVHLSGGTLAFYTRKETDILLLL